LASSLPLISPWLLSSLVQEHTFGGLGIQQWCDTCFFQLCSSSVPPITTSFPFHSTSVRLPGGWPCNPTVPCLVIFFILLYPRPINFHFDAIVISLHFFYLSSYFSILYSWILSLLISKPTDSFLHPSIVSSKSISSNSDRPGVASILPSFQEKPF